jgi:hypothetical protein
MTGDAWRGHVADAAGSVQRLHHEVLSAPGRVLPPDPASRAFLGAGALSQPLRLGGPPGAVPPRALTSGTRRLQRWSFVGGLFLALSTPPARAHGGAAAPGAEACGCVERSHPHRRFSPTRWTEARRSEPPASDRAPAG